MPNIRIAFVITGLGTGGAEASLLQLLSNLERSRFDPLLISLDGPGDHASEIARIGVPHALFSMRRATAAPREIARFVRAVRRFRPTIVQGWMYHANLLSALTAPALHGARIVWNVRHSNLDPELHKRATLGVIKCTSLLSGVPDAIVFNAQSSRRLHEGIGYRADRSVVIPNGFDTERFAPSEESRRSVRAELGLAPDARIVGMVARYHSIKDHPTFLTAANAVLSRGVDAHFVLCGEGIDETNREIAPLVASLAQRSRVHLLGRRSDIPRLVASFDLLALTSLGEAFPRAVGEAMASGVPCVATDVGDCAFLIGECGRIVPVGDVDRLADALCGLLSDEEERRSLGLRARARILDSFGLQAVTASYENLYERIAGGEGVAQQREGGR